MLVKAIVFPSVRLFQGVSPAKGQSKGTGKEDVALLIKREALPVQQRWESEVTFMKSEVNGKVASHQLPWAVPSETKLFLKVMSKARTSEQSSINNLKNTEGLKARKPLDLMLAL